jgi:hypothetical protein
MDYLALTFPTSAAEPDAQPVIVARARDLTALAERLRAVAPNVSVELFDGPAGVRVAGRPVWGAARGSGRVIFLCGPPAQGRAGRAGRPFDATGLPEAPRDPPAMGLS